jgi:hypothetical protein
VRVKREKTKKKKFKKEKKTMRERKVENGRDDVLMTYTTRILKRICTMTIWRCQEN